jgi:hypothetical protein
MNPASWLPGVFAGFPQLLGILSGAGWPGVLAMVLGGIGLFYSLTQVIKRWNRSVDKTDLTNAGADAGDTSADLANQAREATQGLEELRQKDPPKDPGEAPQS